MVRNVGHSPAGSKKDKNGSSDGYDSEENKTKGKKREVNSWDRSSSDADDLSPKIKGSDWDASSDCHETMVEPFEEKVSNECDDDHWGFDLNDNIKANNIDVLDENRVQSPKPIATSFSSFNSQDLSILDLSEENENNIYNMIKVTDEQQQNYKNSKHKGNTEVGSDLQEEDSLLVEDIEEFMKQDSFEEKLETERTTSCGYGNVSNRSQGTAGDTTVWMIPKSDRTSSSVSSNNLVTASERLQLEALNCVKITVKKSKSSSGVEKRHRRKSTTKLSGSDCLNNLEWKRGDLSNFSMPWEGSSFQKKLIQNKQPDKGGKSFDEPGVYFTEYECRAVTTNNVVPEKMIETTTNSDQEESGESNENTENQKELEKSEETSKETIGGGHHALSLAGPSTQTSLEVVSLPDIIGRNSIKDRQIKEKLLRRVNSPGQTRIESEQQTQPNIRPRNESWFLLDETGQYQPVTRDEVTILLNGRSADAVLQGHKEHFIQSPTLPEMANQNGSLGGMITKESIQNILREEDTGGEGQDKKPIDLERKVENTLLYIQPGINLTASIRIIPVDTEMIHIWRRSRDNGSLLSSEVDLRLQPSQDSVENPNIRLANEHHITYTRRMTMEKTQQTVTEQDENLEVTNGSASIVSNKVDTSMLDYSKLLIETRMIVDNLTNSFKHLQTRLDGETNRSSALQGEVRKLRKLLGGSSEKSSIHDRENPDSFHRSQSSSSSSVVSVPHSEKVMKKDDNFSRGNSSGSENATYSIDPADEAKISKETISSKLHGDPDYITVNIYTTDDNQSHCDPTEVIETNSLLQTNLGIIEGKMKRLEEENDVITKQNTELKEKLKEISLELEKYLTNTTETDECLDEDKDKDMDALRDQVCNLKLELDNLKRTTQKQERELRLENAMMREKLEINSINLEEWLAVSDQVFREVENSKIKLGNIGVLMEDGFNSTKENISEPRDFTFSISSFIRRITGRIIALHNENWLREKNLKNETKEIVFDDPQPKHNRYEDLETIIFGYENLIKQCRKGALKSGDQVLEDYFAVIMEKASLIDEIKILKTENEMLTHEQTDNHEKLKQTMMALKDQKQEIVVLQSAQKLLEEEKNQMMNLIKSYENQRAILENDVAERSSKIKELIDENKVCHTELMEKNHKLEDVVKAIENLEKTCRLKDDLINKFKMENDQLLKMEEIKKNQIEDLKTEINDLEIQRTQLDSEITSVKLLTNQSQKEMTEYINHLETIVGNNQEALEKNKQKLKETNQMLTRLKAENEALERQNQCDIKLQNKTNEELEACQKKIANLNETNQKLEEERDRLCEKLQSLVDSERQMSEAVDSLRKECKTLKTENDSLKQNVEISLKDRDETLKEQKDLINKYAILSKELQKLQDKYRYVKAECNERTNVIQYLEMILKENAHDYNNKISYLENNITHILDKIAACKYSMTEKNDGVDAHVEELQEQLNILYRERKELEDAVGNYHTVMKQLENEIQDREKEVEELQVRLSIEQQKWVTESRGRKSYHQERVQAESGGDNDKYVHCERSDPTKIKRLENDIRVAQNELAECKKKLTQTEMEHENEKRKLELTIVDLKSEINRYQLRIEVMMKNLFNGNKSLSIQSIEKKTAEELTRKLQIISKESEVKDAQIIELHDVINKYKINFKLKEGEIETLQKKNFSMSEMLKNLQNHLSKMEATLATTNKSSEKQQKEKNEIAEKLLQSIKIIMEEKSARQTIELLSVEKEKSFKEQLEHYKNELEIKVKHCCALTDEIDHKKRFILKLQHDLKKMKLENATLRNQANENCCNFKQWEDQVLNKSNSLTQIKISNCSPVRLESCLKELKESRDVNLMLRKSEGEYQAKIVRLEDEIRDARLMIKELEGGIKIERRSRKALRSMIMSAKVEINRCLMEKQIISIVADKINRHLDLEEFECRGYRGPRKSNSSESYT